MSDIRYLAYWDSLGFETIINITEIDKKKVFAALAEKELDPADKLSLTLMIVRARANPQRFPEIWTFTSEIDRDFLWNIAQEQPQMLADLIRKNGHCIFVTPRNRPVIV